jgi:hypothetical protein
VSARTTEAVLIVGGVGVLVAAIALLGPAIRHSSKPLPTVHVGGVVRAESCLSCHADVEGLGAAHAGIGCSACHLGDPTAREARVAHRGMELLPGDLHTSARTCGQAGCHPIEHARVLSSLMARAPGILAVDRFAFGERATPDGDESDDLPRASLFEAPRTAAESHARKLCGSCHLAARKERLGDLGESSRGGGCAACHLAPPAPSATHGDGPLHPDVSASVSERRCIGCHSRSGRIALSYRGLVELEATDERVVGHLPDGRPVGRASEDVHASGGMTCVDCHTERELMGDGTPHRHAHEGLEVACADCHGGARGPRVEQPPSGDREQVADLLRKAWARAGRPVLPEGPPLRTTTGTPLWRTHAPTRTLALSDSGDRRAIPPAQIGAHHTLAGHERLDCQACHSAWAPRCTSCHTRFDLSGSDVDHATGRVTRGRWIETAGGNGYGPPVLAIGPRGTIGPFVEGMHLTLENVTAAPIERTLWAPLEPHTTGRSRACPSCHAPAVIDAVAPGSGEVTRSAPARLLDDEERARMARVGACIECHPRYEDPVWRDFASSRARLETPRAKRAPGDRVARCKAAR